MVAIIMPSLNSLIKQLRIDYPTITIRQGDDFIWSPSSKTVSFDAASPAHAIDALLHEVAHALLDHQTFIYDLELLSKEVEAWDYCQTVLGPRYNHSIPHKYVENQLDSYRDWLHLRSLCPSCNQTGIQTQTNHYTCINCSGSWRVNDARRCRLRRVIEV